MIRVLIADPLSPEGIEYLRGRPGLEVETGTELSPRQLGEKLQSVQALIVRSHTRVNSKLIDQAPGLKVIARAGAGVDNIDVEAATRRGIVVMNTPGSNSLSAAEHAFALLLTLARKITRADASLRAGQWKKKEFTGQELQGKLLGILGLGRIGALLAQRAISFQMRVLTYDPFVSRHYASDLGVEVAPLEQVLAQSDFISLHLPLSEATRGIINRDNLELMKPEAMLINTARGGLIVEEDLLEALNRGRLGGAALDVFEEEPQVHPGLIESPRTVLTPHIAGSTVEAQSKVGYQIAVQVARYLENGVIVNAVNFPSLSSQELEHLQPYIRLGEKLGSFLGQISQIRISEIGIRYYGELAKLNFKPISNYILKSVLHPILDTDINEISVRSLAEERGISVIETTSTRERSYSNLISLQLRSEEKTEWVEGAILHQGNLRLVSVDGIPVEAQLGECILLIRNQDRPGVIGQIGTVLGEAGINIASFVLGRGSDHAWAVGVVNTDSDIPGEVMDKIRALPAVSFARVIHL